jgi:hypothetical protein
VLEYARKVAAYRDEFAQRGVIAPPYDQPGARPSKPREAPTLATMPVPYGPTALPSADADAQPAPEDDR